MLSERFQISESLAEDYEAVEEARPPMQSGQDQCFSSVLRWECSVDALLEQGGRRSCVRGLRVIVLWCRSSSCRSGLQRAATSAWHNIGDYGAVCGGLLSTSLPSCGGVAFCCVLFMWW